MRRDTEPAPHRGSPDPNHRISSLRSESWPVFTRPGEVPSRRRKLVSSPWPAEFFRRAQGESRKGAEQGKAMLGKRLAG
jgi:hypothetical protein